MNFEWDDAKARSNRAKHGVDFEAARDFDFDTAYYAIDDVSDEGEERWLAIGLIGFQVHALVFAERGMRIRVISLRRATMKEMKDFYER